VRPIVPPPYEVQQRAWDCAYVLRADFAGRLPLEQRVQVEVIYRTHPEGLGWQEVAAMLVLYREIAGVRV